MKDKEKIFIDTNVLVYSIYGTPEQKKIIALLLSSQIVLPTISIQVLKEFVNVSIKKKFTKTTTELKHHLTKTKQSFIIAETGTDTILLALDINEQYHCSFYDSLIIATALENKCHILVSEDLQHGQIIRKKLKILNPFK